MGKLKTTEKEILEIINDSSIENGDYSIVFYYIDNSFDRKIQTDIKGLFSNVSLSYIFFATTLSTCTFKLYKLVV